MLERCHSFTCRYTLIFTIGWSSLPGGVLASNSDSVNVWVIVLPVTGIILVCIAALICICRYICRFLSFCSKQWEKHNENSSSKVVHVEMPHSNMDAILGHFDNNNNADKPRTHPEPSAPCLEQLDIDSVKGSETTALLLEPELPLTITLDNVDFNHMTESMKLNRKSFAMDKTDFHHMLKCQHLKLSGWAPSPTQETTVLDEMAPTGAPGDVTMQNNAISEIDAPQITITVH